MQLFIIKEFLLERKKYCAIIFTEFICTIIVFSHVLMLVLPDFMYAEYIVGSG